MIEAAMHIPLLSLHRGSDRILQKPKVLLDAALISVELYKEPSINRSMASIAVCGGVNNDSTICFIIKLKGVSNPR